MIICHMLRLMIWVRHTQHHVARHHNLLKVYIIHHQSVLPPRADSCVIPEKIDVGAKPFEIQMVHSQQ